MVARSAYPTYFIHTNSNKLIMPNSLRHNPQKIKEKILKQQEQNITENKINPANTFVGVDALVGLPPLQLNEIYNDDSFKLIERVPAKTVDLILEDMPYNTTACEWDVKIDLQLYWETRLRILKPTGTIILTATQPFSSMLVMSNGKMFKYDWIWIKNKVSGLINKQPVRAYEAILIFYKSGNVYNEIMMKRTPYEYKLCKRERDSVSIGSVHRPKYESVLIRKPLAEQWYKKPLNTLEFTSDDIRDGNGHPTQKPVGLFEYLIRTYTNEGDLVFDGFGGSGTTAVAAHKAKRKKIF
jgi:site-specific DNA-methyltransferase (adenine-specific)